MTNVRIKPVNGLVVRDPETKRPLPVDGKVVRFSSFWIRRKLAGEIIICDEIKKTINEESES